MLSTVVFWKLKMNLGLEEAQASQRKRRHLLIQLIGGALGVVRASSGLQVVDITAMLVLRYNWPGRHAAIERRIGPIKWGVDSGRICNHIFRDVPKFRGITTIFRHFSPRKKRDLNDFKFHQQRRGYPFFRPLIVLHSMKHVIPN